MTRQDGRAFDELRPIKITPDFVKFAEGSCLIQCGDTMVLCCASVEDRVPPHVPEGTGWVTAEYSMLPRANRERSRRDISKLKLSPRSAEIQRLIGRSLRAAVDMELLGDTFTKLAKGEEVIIPKFEFARQMRSAIKSSPLRLGKDEIAIFEGIHALNDIITGKNPNAMKVYILSLIHI